MSSFFTILIIGISLSMDAFSLALAYGISGINHKQKIVISIIVGIYHFFMPLIGLQFGSLLDKINIINLDVIASLILIYIGIDLIISNFKKEEKLTISPLGFIMFGISVSIDSLTVGVGLTAVTQEKILACLTFSITSLIFTYLGLSLGNIIGNKIGSYSKIIGGIILLIIAITIFMH